VVEFEIYKLILCKNFTRECDEKLEEFKCNNGLCYAGWQKCNGNADCGDGTDESGC
jgi:hypothetical protein